MDTILKQQLLSLGTPENDYQHHIFLSPLQLHKNSKLHTKLSLLIEKYVQETKGQRGAKQPPPSPLKAAPIECSRVACVGLR